MPYQGFFVTREAGLEPATSGFVVQESVTRLSSTPIHFARKRLGEDGWATRPDTTASRDSCTRYVPDDDPPLAHFTNPGRMFASAFVLLGLFIFAVGFLAFVVSLVLGVL